MHHCFTDFILAHLEKSAYQVDLDDEVALLSAEEREQIWRREYPHPCRTTCPGSASRPLMWHEADGLSDDDDYDIANSTGPLDIAQGLPRTRPTTRSSTTTLSPLFGNLDVGPAPMNIIQDPPSPVLAAFGSSPPLALPTDPVEETNINYQPLEAPHFLNFQMVENKINQSRIVPAILEIDEPFSIMAGSVSAAAEGFVNALKGVKQDAYAKFIPYQTTEVPGERDANFYSIEPAEVTLSTMFSWGSWIFKA
jgi:hypothetical protein